MTLDQIEALANDAGPDWDWHTAESLLASCGTSEAAYIAAMSPDTAKKLIAVARAAQDAHEDWSCGFEPIEPMDALGAALNELDGKPQP